MQSDTGMSKQLQQEHATDAAPEVSSGQTVGHAIVEALIARGTDTMFGLPGIQLDPLFSALYDCRNRIRVIDSRHEQGAAYMAFGYAEASSRPGVFAVVPGPGLLNAGAALATAYACGSPVLGMIGHMGLSRIGTNVGDLHDLPDQTGIVTRLVRHHRLVEDPAEAGLAVDDLLDAVEVVGSGPAAIELPADLLAAPMAFPAARPVRRSHQGAVVPLETIARLLANAKSPLIFAGRGAVHASEEMRALSGALGGVPVVTQGRGKGIVPDTDPLSMPIHSAAALWNDADVVLAVGTRMRHVLQAWPRPEGQVLIVIDHDSSSAPAVPMADHFVAGDAKTVLAALARKVQAGQGSDLREPWRRRAEAARRHTFAALDDVLAPQMGWVRAIRSRLPDNGLIVTDYTQIAYVANIALPMERPGNIITPGYQGTLGFSFPTALGVKVAHPDRPVIAIAGDGGFMFTANELATAVKYRIGVVTLLFNDSRYSNVQRMQIHSHGGRVIASDLVNPDFHAFVRSFGAHAHRVDTPEALSKRLAAALEEELPTVIEVIMPMLPDPWPFIFPDGPRDIPPGHDERRDP